MAKLAPPERFAYITRGAFAGRRAEILADFGTFAHLAVDSGVLNVPETDFIRLVSLYGIPEAVIYNPYQGAPRGIAREGLA